MAADDPDEHPFAKLSKGYHARQAAAAAIQYEERCVLTTLRILRLSHWERALRRRQQNETSGFNLTFANFNEEFSSFPLLLGATNLGGKKLHIDASCLLPALFKSFETSPFVVAYEAFLAARKKAAHGRTVGLVFPRKGIPKGLIIHNEGADEIGYAGLQAVYVGENGSPRYVRSYRLLLEALDRAGHGAAAEAEES